jgi:hypothetical protein
LLLVFLVAAQKAASAQYRPFDRFNFEDGGYTLLGIFEHHDDHPVQKKVGEFYTDNITVLNAVKKAWNFPRTQAMHACGYHYNIVLLHKGKRVEDLSINLDCKEVVTDKGSRLFDSSLLTRFSTRFTHLFSRSSNFSSIEAARDYWFRMRQNDDFVYAFEPEWLKYEGSFRFRTQCPKETKDCYMFGRDGEILAAVREKIARSYPGEKFELKSSGGSSDGEAFFEIECDGSLEAKFDVYDRWNKEHFGKWEPFALELRSYWKKG